MYNHQQPAMVVLSCNMLWIYFNHKHTLKTHGAATDGAASQQQGGLHYLTEVTTQNDDITQLPSARHSLLSSLFLSPSSLAAARNAFSQMQQICSRPSFSLFINLTVNWNSTLLGAFERVSWTATNQFRQPVNTRTRTQTVAGNILHTRPCSLARARWIHKVMSCGK